MLHRAHRRDLQVLQAQSGGLEARPQFAAVIAQARERRGFARGKTRLNEFTRQAQSKIDGSSNDGAWVGTPAGIMLPSQLARGRGSCE